MKKTVRIVSIVNLLALTAQTAQAALPKWSYDPGPDPKSKMGRELIDHVATIPNMPDVSMKVMGEQKFRPAFGPVNWRMLQGKNKVKILFIGQDATHIAEAAGRTATAGFGGRGQDLAAYFGVNEGAGFMNTYSYTIKGQYGGNNTPYFLTDDSGSQVRFGNLVENKLWLMTHDQDSPMVKWRNGLIDWIIRNNKDSLKLIVTFGGAARDAIATFIESKGGEVGAKFESQMKKIQVAESDLTFAGGNNEYPILLDRQGKDVHSKLLNRRVDYGNANDQKAVRDDIVANLQKYMDEVVFSKAGAVKNGLMHPAQIGGFDLDKISINGKNTRSLQGLPLKDGSTIKNKVLVVELPHPTYLSNKVMEAEAVKPGSGIQVASEIVAEDLKVLEPYVKEGWTIAADEGMENQFAVNRPYTYGRKDIGTEYYDFGAPGSRMVPVSDAARAQPHIITFGTRDRAAFNNAALEAATKELPATAFSEEELFIARPRSKKLRYVFDAGPGEKYAKIMKSNLDIEAIFTTKSGQKCSDEAMQSIRGQKKICEAIFKSEGIDAFVVKSGPGHADFGHYRGTFKKPRVVIFADPQGHDDLITARALTGSRGQTLHRLMEDLKIKNQYLVIKTVPFSMDGASAEDWKAALNVTAAYRNELMTQILEDGKPELIIADGLNAQAEVARMLNKNTTIPVINIGRSSGSAADDIAVVANELKQIFPKAKISLGSANIPRAHLSYYARTWEGTSGDRVFAATDKMRGFAYAEVAPQWAWSQKAKETANDDVKLLLQKLEENKLPMPGEKIPVYLERKKNLDASVSLILDLLKIVKIA